MHKKLYLKKEVKHLKLSTNRPMRVHLQCVREADVFAMLRNVVDGKANIVQQPDIVSVAELGNSVTSVDDLIDKVFPKFQENIEDSD